MLTFFNEIITGNVDIPVLLVNDAGSIIASRNIEINGATTLQQLPVKVQKEFMHYEPILVQYRATKNFIYYKDSNLFSKLKKTLNDLVETFISEVVLNTASAPVILTDEKMNVIHFGNLDSTLMESETESLVQIKRMQAVHEPIVVDLGEGMKRFIYYDDRWC